MYTLFVSLQVHPHMRAQFLRAIAENAQASVRDEPGCLRFDVMEDANQADRFYFYEIYTEPSAFDAHKAAPHFAVWREAAAQCVVAGSQVNTFANMLATHASAVSA